MKTKNKKDPAVSSDGAPAPVIEAARAMDQAIMDDASGGQDTARTIMSDEQPPLPGMPEAPAPAKGGPRSGAGRPKGSKTKTKSIKGTPGAVAATLEATPPDPMIVALLAQLTSAMVQLSKANGWTEPQSADLKDGKLVFTHEAWMRDVQNAELAVYQKYCPAALNEYAAEITLGVLVIPWLAANLFSMLKRWKEERERKNNGDHRNNGDGKDVAAFGFNGQGASAPVATGHNGGPEI